MTAPRTAPELTNLARWTIVGLLAVNIVKPGVGVNLSTATTDAGAEFAKTKTTFAGVIEHTVPQSFFEAASKNYVMQAEKLRDAARSKDLAATEAVAKDFGRQACGACHTPFRVPPPQQAPAPPAQQPTR